MAEKTSWAAAEKAASDAKKAEAESKARAAEAAAKISADKAKAESDAVAGKVKLAEIEAKAAKDKADADERAATRAADAKKDGDSLLGTVAALAKQYAPAIAAGVALGIGGKIIAARSGKAAAKAVTQIEELGTDAAKLNKIKGPIVGTPAGDQMKAVVTEANRRGAPHFKDLGKTPAAADVAAAALMTEGAITMSVGMGVDKAAGFDLGLSDESRATMRTVGLGSLVGATALKTTLALGKAGAPKPSAKATAAIEAGSERIARETAAGAGKAGQARIGKTVAQAQGELAAVKTASKVDAAIAAVKGKTAVAVAGQRGKVSKQIAAVKGDAKVSALNVEAAIAAVKGETAVAATGARGKVSQKMIAAKGEAKVAAAKGTLRGPAGQLPPPAAPIAANDARGLSGLLQGAPPLPPTARRAAMPRSQSSGNTYTRTYKSGPKAGLTETVSKPRR